MRLSLLQTTNQVKTFFPIKKYVMFLWILLINQIITSTTEVLLAQSFLFWPPGGLRIVRKVLSLLRLHDAN